MTFKLAVCNLFVLEAILMSEHIFYLYIFVIHTVLSYSKTIDQ